VDSGLLRQRRNIVSISCVLLVYDFADIKIKQVGFMGTAVEIGNPAALSIMVWVVWLYFFVRYYQYWAGEKDAYVLRDLREMVKERSRKYCIKKYVLDSNYGWDGGVDIKRNMIFSWCLERREYSTGTGSNVAESHKIPIGCIMAWSCFSFASYCFHKKHMSDHILPFALAISALLVKIYSML